MNGAGAAAAPVTLHIEGDGPRTVVLIHGWPDTHRLWDPQVEALRGHYRCVRFTLPGFDPADPSGPYSLDAVVAAIQDAIDRASPDQPVTLLLHDWGCFFGYQYTMRHPGRVARVIGVDIGDAGSRYHRQETSLRAMWGIVSYQLWLAAAWRIGGARGDRMARWMATRLRAPAAASVTAAIGYPYAVQWLGVAGGYGRLRAFAPKVPMLFIHGERKPFGFHSRSWADRVAARPGCRVIGMPTGHWVMVQQPAVFNATVLEWLQRTDVGLH